MKVGFIGVGGMAQAMIKGLIKSQQVMPGEIVVHSAHQSTYEPLAQRMGLVAATTNRQLVQESDVIILAVTPNAAKGVLREIREDLKVTKQVLVSVVAGLELAEMEEIAGYDLPILRTLPNLNVAVLAGMTAIQGNNNLVGDKRKNALALFEALGTTTELPEANFATFSALAGSSPAYVYFFIDALSRAAVKHGLNKDQATEIAAQVVAGSAQMVLSSDEVPFALIDHVSSPGGSTVAGLLAMEEAGFMTAVVKGIDATIHSHHAE